MHCVRLLGAGSLPARGHASGPARISPSRLPRTRGLGDLAGEAAGLMREGHVNPGLDRARGGLHRFQRRPPRRTTIAATRLRITVGMPSACVSWTQESPPMLVYLVDSLGSCDHPRPSKVRSEWAEFPGRRSAASTWRGPCCSSMILSRAVVNASTNPCGSGSSGGVVRNPAVEPRPTSVVARVTL